MDTQQFDISSVLSAIIESSDDAIISKKIDGTIISWNEAAEKIFGYTAAEAINNNISMIIPAELMDEERQIINKVKRGERIKHYETLSKTKDGSKISIDLSISPIRDGNGNVIAFYRIVRDITEQKLMNEKQAILSSIVNSSGDAIISKTLDGTITSWNLAAQKMFGYTETELLGRNISIIIPPARLEEESMILEKIRQDIKVDHFATVRLTKNK